MKMGYGEFIKRHRLASGFKSQRQLAERSGVSRTTISRMEKEVQKPSVDTLKELAPYLHTTSLVELMVIAGYWDEDELLEPVNIDIRIPAEKFNTKSSSIYIKETPSNTNEKEFVNKLELSDEELLKQFDLELDGKKITENEAKGIIAYLRSLRSIDK